MVELYDNWFLENKTSGVKALADLDEAHYKDSDIPKKLPKDLEMSP